MCLMHSMHDFHDEGSLAFWATLVSSDTFLVHPTLLHLVEFILSRICKHSKHSTIDLSPLLNNYASQGRTTHTPGKTAESLASATLILASQGVAHVTTRAATRHSNINPAQKHSAHLQPGNSLFQTPSPKPSLPSVPPSDTPTKPAYPENMPPAISPATRSALGKLARRALITTGPALSAHHFERRGLGVNHTQGVTLGVIAAYVVVIALLWNLPYVRWVLWPFKVRTCSLGHACMLSLSLCHGLSVLLLCADY
jgi:hypothetical protein